jgi:hypothetical protein
VARSERLLACSRSTPRRSMEQDMDRRVLLTRRHSEGEQPLDALNSEFTDVELGLETQAELSTADPSELDADLTPTPQEVAEAVFVGRRIGKRRRSEILRELLERGYQVPVEVSPELDGPQKVRRSFHAVLALAAIALVGGVLFREADRGGYALELWVTIPDLIVAFCAATFGVEAIKRTRRFRSSTLTTGGVLLFGALAVSFPFHPTARGVLVLIRLLGAVGVADALQRANRTELRRAVQFLTGGVLASGGIALGQFAVGGPLGLHAFGERVDPFFDFGRAKVPSALLGHPYPLGGAALVAGSLVIALVLAGRLQNHWSYVGGIVTGFGSVFSGSRTNVLGLTLLVLAVVIGARRSHAKRAFAFVISAATAGVVALVLNPAVWTSKSDAYKANGDISAGRVELFKENVEMVRRHTLVGVGPGRYNIALKAEGITQSTGFPHPPQVVAMSALAEGGILAGFSLLVIGGAVFGIVRRRRLPAILPLVALASPLFTDHYMWTSVEGMALVAIAFGVAYRLSRESLVREVAPQASATS